MFEMNFDWNWIKDKQIVIEGDEDNGVIMIENEDGILITMYIYERVEKR
jgi:hypothetical protein